MDSAVNVDLICIGNEILLGKIQELNAHFLAKELLKYQLHLRQIHIIKDDQSSLHQTLDFAYQHASVVITCGGLGPTEDDYTKKYIANYWDKKLIDSPQALAITQKNYQRFNRVFKHGLNHYHLIPEDFSVHENPCGHAPALSFFSKGKGIYLAPGVPGEFQAIVTQIFIPLILKQLNISNDPKSLVIVKTFGIPEQKIFSELCPDLWTTLAQYGEVSSLPHVGGVDIGVVLKSEQIQNHRQKVLELICNPQLQEAIWHVGPESLEQVIINKAQEKNLSFGFAESCTGGLNAQRITSIPGSSQVFIGSIVAYSNKAKENILKVPTHILQEYGAVSIETAKEMAKGARELLSCDIAIATTGIAGPGGGSLEKPVGTVAIAVATKTGQSAQLYQFTGNRQRLTQVFSQYALMSLLKSCQ